MDHTTYLLEKYATIIQEEVNVKEIWLLPDELHVEVTYVPRWQALGPRFGKDTSRIIDAARSGGTTLQPDGKLTVVQWTDERVLLPDEYEIRYSGLQEDHQTIENGVVVSLDMIITDELKDEGVAREISRFLNQMRKDAQYNIDTKVNCYFHTSSSYLESILDRFSEMLQHEALLNFLEKKTISKPDINSDFEHEDMIVTFQLSQ